jgi:hypothetical protein
MTSEAQVVTRLIGALKEQMADIAENAMLMPKPDLFGNGITAGRYQGLMQALNTVEAILRDDYDKEIKS